MVNEFLFENKDTMLAALALKCQNHLTTALDKYGKASLMVSGGSTPAPLYEMLSVTDLDWKNIKVALVDERWVAFDHNASNEAFISRTLLVNEASKAMLTGMKTQHKSAVEGCPEIETHYRSLPHPFTLAILGMGSDGHTASLFPHADGLAAALNPESEQLTAAITARQSDVTGPNTERLTLTLPGLLKSERLILLLTGQEKLDVFRKAAAAGPVEDMPVRAVIRQKKVPMELYWAP